MPIPGLDGPVLGQFQASPSHLTTLILIVCINGKYIYNFLNNEMQKKNCSNLLFPGSSYAIYAITLILLYGIIS